MNNINDLNIKIFDEKIFDKFENNCNDIFDNIFNFIIFIIYKYYKIFIIFMIIIIYAIIRNIYINKNKKSNHK